MSTIYLSETAHPLLKNYLISQGYQLNIIKKNDRTYDPVNTHPDIYMCSMGHGGSVYFGSAEKIGMKYPENIIYNAACTGKYFIHNLKHTDPELLKMAESIEKINVSQGYTKCSTVIVNETGIITSDVGIHKSCYGKLDVLLIDHGHIKLKNFPYGFIGGTCGRIGSTIVFNGNLEEHPDCSKIIKFIEERGLSVKYFKEYPLEDIGSIICDDEIIK